MNKFKKYCPNVWVAECEQKHEKGEIITLETKYGKEVDCKVYNLIAERDGLFYYSIIRIEEQTYAEKKAEKYNNASNRHKQKSDQYFEASQEGGDFLIMGEPIKVGHHSEKRHRALIERNNKRINNSIEYQKKAEEAQRRAAYWEDKAEEITLAVPESIEYFGKQLAKAKSIQAGLKDGSIPRKHAYSLTYATKDVKELTKKYEIAKTLWGNC